MYIGGFLLEKIEIHCNQAKKFILFLSLKENYVNNPAFTEMNKILIITLF